MRGLTERHPTVHTSGCLYPKSTVHSIKVVDLIPILLPLLRGAVQCRFSLVLDKAPDMRVEYSVEKLQ